jgi:hypothetical protein
MLERRFPELGRQDRKPLVDLFLYHAAAAFFGSRSKFRGRHLFGGDLSPDVTGACANFVSSQRRCCLSQN